MDNEERVEEEDDTMKTISAVVLAAGRSTRMGGQKLLLPWGETTVIGKVIETLQSADIENIVLVTNSEVAEQISKYETRITQNNDGEMLSSLQLGLQALLPPPSLRDTYPIPPKRDGVGREGVLVCLGDQPQIKEGSVRSVCKAFLRGNSNIVVPSYQMRRGHPWLVARSLCGEILAMQEGESMREFMKRHAEEIEYVNVDTPTILQDLDTPEDYLKYKPGL